MSALAQADPKKPLGGHVLAHASQVRLYARKGKGEQRVLKVVQSMTSGDHLGFTVPFNWDPCSC